MWAKLSLRYTNEFIHFYRVDVSLMESIAKKYKIDASASGQQLPTVLMIENGKETSKYPPEVPSGSRAAGKADYNIIEKNIIDIKISKI